jgi:glutamine amidotransferase
MSLSEPPTEALADVVIVDYGLGNLRSATRGLERAGAAVTITDDPDDFADADGIVLPGVGAFREGMENAGPYRDALADAVARGQPVFGICLGMQMLLTSSEEADHAGEGEVVGLDFVPGRNVRFDEGQKVPHMGWNDLSIERDHPIVSGVDEAVAPDRDGPGGGSVDGEYAYFVHSYYAVPEDDRAVIATTDHGRTFPAVVANEEGTVFGTQFHPEKSGETGLTILRNFVDICSTR